MNALQITNVSQVGPFLQICGHKDKNLLIGLNDNIEAYLPRLIETAPSSIQFEPHEIYLVHNPRTDKYFRCYFIEQRQSHRVTVEFIDYGNEFDVSAQNIIALNPSIPEARFLATFPPIATKYILADFHCCWQQNQIEIIRKDINNTSLQIQKEQTDNSFRFISLVYEGCDLTLKLVHDQLGTRITLSEQIALLMSFINSNGQRGDSNAQRMESMRSSKYHSGRNLVPTRPLQSNRTPAQLIQSHLAPPKPSRAPIIDVGTSRVPIELRTSVSSIPVFTAHDLAIGSHCMVYVSFVHDGPKLFSIQLKRNECSLDRLTNDLPNVPLKHLSTTPTIGMACIARYSEDNNLYRAAIMNIQLDVCRVTFVDYGNSEDVPHAEIYEIPDKFLEQKTFSIQFSLYDCKQLEPIDADLKEYFEQLVKNEEFEMKVMPIDGTMYVQYCELYLKHRSVLDILRNKQIESKTYSNPRQLVDDDCVIIRYVNTVKLFYVQRTVDIPKFDKLMDRLMDHCLLLKPMSRMPNVGECCAALQNNNNVVECFRVQIVNIIDKQRTLCQYVDYGFVGECDLHQLRNITSEFLEMPRQVTACCLIEFDKIEEVPETTNKQLDMLAENRHNERRQFRVSIRDRMPDSLFVVNLFDDSEKPTINVSSSLYKLLMPRKHYGGKVPSKHQSSADCTIASVLYDVSSETFSCDTNSSADPKWEGRTQSTPAMVGQHQKRASTIEPTKLNWNTSNDSSIKLCKSREPDGSEMRSNFTERTDETRNRGDRNSNRIYNGNTSADIGNADKRVNNNVSSGSSSSGSSNRNSNSWRTTDDNSGSGGYDGIRTSRRRSTETIGTDKRNARNIKDRLILQKHLIPRFNKSSNRSTSRKSNSDGKIHSDIEINNNNNVEMVESGYCSNAKFPRRPVESIAVEEFVGFDTKLPDTLIPLGSISRVIMVTWLTPHSFHVQLKSFAEECDEMMMRLQDFYQKRPHIVSQVPNDAIVIGRQKSDNAFKRVKIIDYNAALKKYRTQSIDYGNKFICVQNDLFQLEKSFTKLPPLAICCNLIDIIRNRSREEISHLIDKYLDKTKSMSCEFIETKNDVTSVKFSIAGVDLKTAMINDGLLSELPSDICLSRLVDQTIFVKPTAIKDLSCFRAQIFGCDISFMCAYKDLKVLKTNPKLSAEFKQLENCNVLVRIDAVTSENVLVLNIFAPFLDIQNTQSPIEIAPYPIYMDNFIVEVSHVESANEIYIQCKNHLDQLIAFLGELYDFYAPNGGVPYTSPIASTLCAVQSPEDQNYYRAFVERIHADNTVTVRYIDYGNTEQIPSHNLKHLDAKFKQLNAFAIKMYVPVKLLGDHSKAIADIKRFTADSELTLKIITYYQNKWIIDLTTHGFSLMDILREKGLAISMDANERRKMIDEIDRVPPKPVEETPVIQPTLPAIATVSAKPKPNGIAAFISHADNPNRFYLHLEADSNDIEKFVETLQIVAPSLPPLTNFRAGVKCIAKYSLDDQWYRAEIIDTDGHITSVLFVDYGNTDSITNNSFLKMANESIDHIKYYALPCALAIRPTKSSEWNTSACRKLRDIKGDQLLHFEYISEDSSINYVTLYDGDRDIAEELINDGCAEPLQVIKNGEKCYVSHSDSLNDFYIQMDTDSNALNLIEEYLSDVSKFEMLAEYRTGTICMAKYEDDKYYRAEVLNDCVDGPIKGTKVQFIDYGNTFVATELRALPKNIAELPKLRKRCALRKPDDIECWSVEAEKKFAEITEMGAAVLTVRLVKPDKTALIELFVGDRNIGTELAELCQKRAPVDSLIDEHDISRGTPTRFRCYITHINSPHDFYVQLVDKSGDIERMVERLQTLSADKLKTIGISQEGACIARYADDGQLYRAKILEPIDENTVCVRYIDYGNESNSSELYELPAELMDEPLAVHCKLTDVQPINEDLMQRHKQLLIEASGDDETSFHEIEVIDSKSDPIVVNYYRDSLNISRLANGELVADDMLNELCTQVQQAKIVADHYLNGILNNMSAN